MGARGIAGVLVGAVLLAASLSQADEPGRIEPLDGGTQSVTSPASEPANRPERGPVSIPQGDFSSRQVTPFGGPLPPNQLTPAPVLPFNPNRSLMPSPSAPSHPPNPAR